MKLTKQQTFQLIASASFAGAIAFFSYKMYKEYKFQQEAIKEAEDIQKELEEKRLKEEVQKELEEAEELEEIRAQSIRELWEEPEEEDEEDYVEDYMDDERGDVEELRFHPDSQEALEQFKNMKLVNLDHSSWERTTMLRLFEVPLQFTVKEDRYLEANLIDERVEFFGDESKWNMKLTVADLLLYYANLANFDLDMGVEYWLSNFLSYIGVGPSVGSATLDGIVHRLMQHSLATEMGYGLFALDSSEYRDMLHELRGQPVTFRSQYNEFVKTQLEMEE